MQRAPRLIRLSIFIIIILVCFFVLIRLEKASNAVNGIGMLTQGTTGVLSYSKQSILNIIQTPFQTNKLKTEVERLQREIRKLTQESIYLRELKDENTKLRQELNFFEKEKYPLVIARVISRVKEAGTTFLVLNKGSADGIQLNAPVIVDGILVAKIIKLQKNASVAVPLTAPTIKTAATFAGSDKTAGIVEGNLNVSLTLELIPKDIPVTAGMLTVTSGLEERIPRGLFIGTTERIESDPQALFQTAYLETPIRLSGVSIVSVIKEYEEE